MIIEPSQVIPPNSMSNWRPCRPSDDSDDAGQPVPEPQDSGITTPVAFEPPYILEPQLQSQSPSMISPILQHDKKQFDSQAYHAEGSYTCSHLPTADVIQEDRLSDDWMANTNTPNLEPASDPPDIRENMALENSKKMLINMLLTKRHLANGKKEAIVWIIGWAHRMRM